MRITETPQRLTLTDVPRGQWLLGLLFVASGLFVLSIPLLAIEWRHFAVWQRLAVLAIGLGHLAGGLYSAIRPAATHTAFDRARDLGALQVWRLWRWRNRLTNRFALTDVQDIEIVRSADADGAPMFQLRLWLRGSQTFWLQAQPVHGEARVRESAERVRRFLGLPPNK